MPPIGLLYPEVGRESTLPTYPPIVLEPVMQYNHCPACRYELGFTEQDRCPECGRVPREVVAEREERRERTLARTRLFALIAVALGLAALLVFIEVEERRELQRQQQLPKIYMLSSPEIRYTPAIEPQRDRLQQRMQEHIDDGSVLTTPPPSR